MRRLRPWIRLGVLALGLGASTGPPSLAASEDLPTANVVFRANQRGRLDWSRGPDRRLAFDRVGPDRYYDVWVTRPGGEGESCLTCDHPDLPGMHAGQPSWHPSERWLVLQVEKADRPSSWTPIGKYLASNPGAGVYNDLWVMDVATRAVHRLTTTPTNSHHAVLHPHFSRDGTQLAWSQMYRKPRLLGKRGRKGSWRIHVAPFEVVDGKPRLGTAKVFEQETPGMMENHGFTPDGSALLYQGDQEADPAKGWTDLWRLDLATGKHTRLTRRFFNEHAHYSPDGKWLAFSSSRDNANGGLDWWLLPASGGPARRLTFFNQPGHPQYKGHKILCADLSWRPDGTGFTGYWHDIDLSTILDKGRMGEGHAEVTLMTPGPLNEVPPELPEGGPPSGIPPGGPPRDLPLDPPIEFVAGVYNPWTDRCSDPAAPVRRKVHVRQPAGKGPYPAFVFLIGTLRKADSETARWLVERAAARGFVAASVDYDTLATDFHAEGPCDAMEAKAACSLRPDHPEAPEAALRLLCSARDLEGKPLGLKIDCDAGIVLAGFSQGGLLAMLGHDHDPRVRAALVLGHHDQAFPDKQPLHCVHGPEGRPPGSRTLPSSRLRMLVGQSDKVLRGPHPEHLRGVSGRACPGALSCLAPDGSGWMLVPDRECGLSCPHEFLDLPAFRDPTRTWDWEEQLDWVVGVFP